jgi:hypothetical protein
MNIYQEVLKGRHVTYDDISVIVLDKSTDNHNEIYVMMERDGEAWEEKVSIDSIDIDIEDIFLFPIETGFYFLVQKVKRLEERGR